MDGSSGPADDCFELSDRRYRFRSYDRLWPHAANEADGLFSCSRMPRCEQPRANDGGASRVPDLAVDVDDPSPGLFAHELYGGVQGNGRRRSEIERLHIRVGDASERGGLIEFGREIEDGGHASRYRGPRLILVKPSSDPHARNDDVVRGALAPVVAE